MLFKLFSVSLGIQRANITTPWRTDWHPTKGTLLVWCYHSITAPIIWRDHCQFILLSCRAVAWSPEALLWLHCFWWCIQNMWTGGQNNSQKHLLKAKGALINTNLNSEMCWKGWTRDNYWWDEHNTTSVPQESGYDVWGSPLLSGVWWPGIVCQQNIITAVCLWVPMENCARRGVPGNLLLLSVISLYFWHLHIQLMGRL